MATGDGKACLVVVRVFGISKIIDTSGLLTESRETMGDHPLQDHIECKRPWFNAGSTFVIAASHINIAMHLIPHEPNDANDKWFLNNTIDLDTFNLICEDSWQLRWDLEATMPEFGGYDGMWKLRHNIEGNAMYYDIPWQWVMWKKILFINCLLRIWACWDFLCFSRCQLDWSKVTWTLCWSREPYVVPSFVWPCLWCIICLFLCVIMILSKSCRVGPNNALTVPVNSPF